MNTILQNKLTELQNASDFECWYLVKQPTAFDNICYLVSFLKEFIGTKVAEINRVKADIENRFINVVNKLIQSKDEIIENLKMINKTICNTDELTKQKNELHQKLVEQVDKIQELIEVNARVVQNQEEYQKEYEKLVSDYELTKTEHKKLELEIATKLSKSETMKMFIKTIEKQEVLKKRERFNRAKNKLEDKEIIRKGLEDYEQDR